MPLAPLCIAPQSFATFQAVLENMTLVTCISGMSVITKMEVTLGWFTQGGTAERPKFRQNTTSGKYTTTLSFQANLQQNNNLGLQNLQNWLSKLTTKVKIRGWSV